MNWLKNIFIKSKKDGDLINSLQKNLFDKLYKFAEAEPSFALKELASKIEGLDDNEVEKRLKIYGYNDISEEKKTNHESNSHKTMDDNESKKAPTIVIKNIISINTTPLTSLAMP